MTELEWPLTRGQSIHIKLPVMTFISVSGSDRVGVSAQAWTASSDGAGTTTARHGYPSHPLEAVKPVPGVSYVDAEVPRSSEMHIFGENAAVELKDIEGTLEVQTTHGKVLVIRCTGASTISALNGGHVAFQGDRGQVDITADIGVDIRCPAEAFHSDPAPLRELWIAARRSTVLSTGMHIRNDSDGFVMRKSRSGVQESDTFALAADG